MTQLAKSARQKICAGIAVAISAPVLGQFQAAAPPASFFERGKSYYQQGDFLSASAALKWATQKEPADATAHYFLGNTLVKLGRLDEARSEYEQALNLSQDPKIRSYSRTALVQLLNPVMPQQNFLQTAATSQANSPALKAAHMTSAATSMPAAPKTLTGSGSSGSSTSGSRAPRASLDLSRQQAAQSIDDQANMTSLGLLNMGNARAQEWQREGAHRAAAAGAKANRTNRELSRYTDEEIAAMQQQSQAVSQDEILQAQERSEKAIQYAKAKVWETQAAAKNLQDLLNEPERPGTIKLKAAGTNLYVRNFNTPLSQPQSGQKGDSGKLNATVPLEATPQLLEDFQGTKGGGTTSEGKFKSSVFGKILH